MRRNSKPFVKREEAAQHRINDKIFASEIRLVIEGEEPQVMSVAKGIALAEEQELDLVEISPNATPPVCKIMDYKKFIYNQKRKQKELKAKQSKVILKEIRFGPNTDDHDFAFCFIGRLRAVLSGCGDRNQGGRRSEEKPGMYGHGARPNRSSHSSQLQNAIRTTILG